MFQPKTQTFFYTVSLSELNDAVKNRGYIRNAITGRVAISSTDCNKGKTLVPVNRLFDKVNSDYLYQANEEQCVNKTDYTPQGIAFYGAAKEKQCGATIPFYRFWNGKNHIYATDLKEGQIIAGPNGTNEGIISYIWPNPNPSTLTTTTTTTTTTSTTTTTTTTTSTTTTTTTTTTRDPLDNPGNCSLNLS